MQLEVNLRDIRVKEVLGNDGDSAVNKAKWDNKTIAVKKYQYDIISENNLYYVCLKFKKINHANILKFYGYTKRIADHYYLLMEYAYCGSLHDQIHGTGVENYTIETALNWMYQCAKGLAFLHEQGIVHCNIKPRNLLLTKNFRQLKIGEFGINRDLVKKRKSPEYLPPEELPVRFNETTYDVFSFGMVLWEVLTRRKPFLEMSDDFTPFLEDLPSDKIRSLIESCWSLNPRERPRMERVATTIAWEIADIQLGEIIGFGSFSVVYKSQLLDVPCAVKEFMVENGDAKEAIEREVKYLSRVTHENIIELFGTKDTKDSKRLILMEFADCGSLYDHIHKKGDYSDSDAFRWMEQLASGLAYLHDMEPRPIIHRDIKTKNLLLTHNYRVLKIADFGIVTLMTLGCMWTGAYMAPEVIKRNMYSEKSDVYSFGIVLWEVMSRKKPFYHIKRAPPLVIMNLVSKGQRPPIEDATDIKDVRTMITNCWKSNPEKRPHMTDLVGELSYYNSLYSKRVIVTVSDAKCVVL